MAFNLSLGRRDIDCGCLAGGGQKLSGWLLARNGLLILAALAISATPSARRLTWLDAVTVVAAVLSVAMAWTAGERLLGGPPARRHP